MLRRAVRRCVQMPPFDCYAVLGLHSSASALEVKQAFYDLAKKHHPDKGGDRERFTRISTAHEVLSRHRPEYDAQRFPAGSRAGPQPGNAYNGAPREGAGTPGGARPRQGQAGLKIRSTNIIDILYSYFGLVLGCIDADLCK